MRRACILGLVLLVAGAGACLWDSDTLKAEAANKMDLVRVITGRFERWPAKYYEVRLERVKKEHADSATSDAKRLELYDDGAVALDRLHRDDEAIALIERKKALLLKLDPKVASHKDHWYRYYANVGTFWAHNWFAKGADRAKIDQLKHARDLIAKAIEINPDAHFGREWAQQTTIEWVIQIEGDKDGLGSFARSASYGERGQGRKDEEILKGLAGLVMLGAGWESVDLFHAIAHLVPHRQGTLKALAGQRVEELLNLGKKSLFAARPQIDKHWVYQNHIEREYRRLRAEADEWAAEREAFVLRRLGEGKHPDTDSDFWQGYVEKPAPEIHDATIAERIGAWWRLPTTPFLLCPAVLIAAIAALYIRGRKRRLPVTLPPS